MPPKKRPQLTTSPGTTTVLIFKTLGLERDDEAMKLLRKVATLVQPLMTKRNWVLPLLREFAPDQKNLLGVNINRGKEIRIRLRFPDSVGAFFDEAFVLGTMLHELTHNIRGPHDKEFYSILDLLTKEHEDNVAKGWTGEAFDGVGIRLGQGGVSHDLDPARAKEVALKAAEQRAKLNRIMLPAGGKKLGSGSNSDLKMLENVLSPREMAALAAERRMKDRIWCGSSEEAGDTHARSGSTESTKTGSASSSKPTPQVYSIDSDDDLEDDDVQLTKKKRSRSPSVEFVSSSSNLNLKPTAAIQSSKHSISSASSIPSNSTTTMWECISCTWPRNDPKSLSCEACLSPKQVPNRCSHSAETAEQTETSSILSTGVWTCDSCSLVNEPASKICEVCERPSPEFLKELEG